MKFRLPSARARGALFWLAVLALIGLRLVLRSDLSLYIVFSPHDDTLYVERAYALLDGGGFGPYDSRTLVKYPGLSLWLAAMRVLGIPFLLSVEIIYLAAGLYFAIALVRAGAHRAALLIGIALYLLNPITFGFDWLRVLREPLDTGLFVLMLGAMAHILVSVERQAATWAHIVVLALAFAFSLYLREENRLLWGLLLLFGIALAWQLRSHLRTRRAVVLIAATVLVPAMVAKAYDYELRSFVDKHYGLPILHEFSEGEYPGLLAAIRSINSRKDNRMVMASQETLAKLRVEVPIFSPVIERLPAPGPSTFSCKLHGVCSEWSNGWIVFWIRDAAHSAGFMPSLPAAQHYFREVSSAIAKACQSGRLACSNRGDGLLPPMQLRWTRAFLDEAWHLAKMSLAPAPEPIFEPPPDISSDLRRMTEAVTLASRDHRETHWLEGWRAALATPCRVVGAVLLVAALAVFARTLYGLPKTPLGALRVVGCVFGLYALFRFAALSYVAVYMGPFDYRMTFSYYSAAMLIAAPFISDWFFPNA